MLDCSKDTSQAFQLCWIKGTSQETPAPHKIIQPVTSPAQKTRMGFYFSNENPAVEKFTACKDIAEGLLVLSSCWPTQTLHVFTTTFPLIFQSLASRARTQLSSSLCQPRNPLPELCVVSSLAGGCPVLRWPLSVTQQCQVSMFSGADKSKLVSNFPPVLPFYKICGRNCSWGLASTWMMFNTQKHQTFSSRPSQESLALIFVAIRTL